MNLKFLEEAKQRITNPELLINVVSRRVRQLTQAAGRWSCSKVTSIPLTSP